jgi:hypothetical protein
LVWEGFYDTVVVMVRAVELAELVVLVVEPVAIGLFADDLDLAGLCVATQHCRHAVGAVELLAVGFEYVEDLSGRQWPLCVGFSQHGADALELAPTYAHTSTLGPIPH